MSLVTAAVTSQPVDALHAIARAVNQAAPKYDIERVYLFGSFARGQASASSDVDLCLETGPSFSLFSAGGFGCEVESALGRRVDLVSEDILFPHVRASMLKERVLVYER